ncbi:hypothetical protein RDWZM_000484 [Blomia tropicalis]|uniref:Uncharacterized protein n=1 Tax=Blomia tropicalis TaxID=40697 RepID=A0A9Q0MAF4_BLOTA|nr:hypothetical protein RDWZM_000484 [Blomia tropicalis]
MYFKIVGVLTVVLVGTVVNGNGYGDPYGTNVDNYGPSHGNDLITTNNVVQHDPFVGRVRTNCIGNGCGHVTTLPVQQITQQQQTVDYLNVPHAQSPPEPANLLVDSHMTPISLVYRSFGAPINIMQKHIPAPPTFRQTQSEEEPHRHLHTIHKPVIQEVREIITPIRTVRQEILPVQENVETVVAKAGPIGPIGGQPVGVPVPSANVPMFVNGPNGLLVPSNDLGNAQGHNVDNGAPFGKGCNGPACGMLLNNVRKLRPAIGRLVAGPTTGFASGDYSQLTTVHQQQHRPAY